MTQRFVEFVMMHSQNAALFLGQIPNPHSGEAEVNLELAKMFIDQLVMIQEKTRGNLSQEEAAVLRNALSNLQMAFVEVSQEGGAKPMASMSPAPPVAASESMAQEPAEPTPGEKLSTPQHEAESRKKFTKSYGA